MTPTVTGLYLLTIIAGNVRFEIISRPGLTAVQCARAGEEWVSSGTYRRYECKPANQPQTTKGKSK